MVVAWIKADIIPDVLHLKAEEMKATYVDIFIKESQKYC